MQDVSKIGDKNKTGEFFRAFSGNAPISRNEKKLSIGAILNKNGRKGWKVGIAKLIHWNNRLAIGMVWVIMNPKKYK